jgi:hypothetical protein
MSRGGGNKKECTSTVIGRRSGPFSFIQKEDGRDFAIRKRKSGSEVKSMGALWLGFGG